ncbi:multiheme c-type cytochrome [Gilvimarinus sp. 2_MG-2023]|uniref:tetratricopeptide repeat protein n=1 Tax=Gilvimarinus sp. 2_MG-2023 TaxID=3062666 RepID=UPI0026E21D6E|nr:tetratricopeptide repeat protein [Gilvimarinus sp. 2_MG-2023]MDO6571084.1 multiheme c-type cytochrome [Gilvimarinus sp. 2_MG-2023]
MGLLKHKSQAYRYQFFVWVVFIAPLSLSYYAVGDVNQCATCHAEQVAQWQQSHHYHAMEIATPKTVLGDFSNQTLAYQGSQVEFSTQENELYITMPNLKGEMQSFQVEFTFGYKPLQQYMFNAGKGKYQLFPFAWDSRPAEEDGQRWFVLYPDQSPNDEFHWSNMGQNWNQMCADCHSTNFKKGFDLENLSYQSSYSTINVSCAACHGEAKEHLQWAAGEKSIANKGYPTYIGPKTPLFRADEQGLMKAIANIKPSRQIQVCASCHSRRAALSDSSGPDNFHHTFRPALISPDLYHSDGQIWDEDYVWGSFLQSKMFKAGVTCTNCHNPHSGELKLAENQVCTQCHSQEVYDKTKHHGHNVGEAGSACVDCHMPATTYMQVDPRRDHGFKVPRPDLTQSLKVPNACNSCHTDKNAKWAEDAIRTWHPNSQYMGHVHFAQTFHNADTNTPITGKTLLQIAQDSNYPEIIRASALYRMSQSQGQNTVKAIAQAVQDNDPLRRQAAIEAATTFPVNERWDMLNTLLSDKHRPIRTQAARTLAPMLLQPLDKNDGTRLREALIEYRKEQTYQADRGFSHTNLGNLELELGNLKIAEKHLLTAIKVEPIFIPAYVNLADLYRAQGNEAMVQEVLKKALSVNDQASSVHYGLAMSYIRQGQKKIALPVLKAAAQAPDTNTNIIYAYALLLQDQGKMIAAISQLLKAYHLEPKNSDIIYTLSRFYAAEGQLDLALFYAKKLSDLLPNNPQIQQIIWQLERQNKE